MATSQDKAQNLKEKFRGKGPQIFMGVMALLLVARIFFFMQESGFQNTAPAVPQEKTDLPSAIKPETEDAVNNMISQYPDFTTKTYYSLARFDMFSAKSVQNAESLMNRANAFVVQAQAAFDRGNLTEAQQLVTEALLVNPSQRNGLLLRDKIDEKIKAASSATSATLEIVPPVTPPPDATPAP